jgi:hypothetical protein
MRKTRGLHSAIEACSDGKDGPCGVDTFEGDAWVVGVPAPKAILTAQAHRLVALIRRDGAYRPYRMRW